MEDGQLVCAGELKMVRAGGLEMDSTRVERRHLVRASGLKLLDPTKLASE